MLVTPLQLAVAYEALANGGKVRAPRVGRAIVTAGGRLIRQIKSPVVGHVPVPSPVLADIRDAMYGVTTEDHGTAHGTFSGFPMHKVRVGGKTGTSEIRGKHDTSWFASFGGPPGEAPQYVVVCMISQGGQGAHAAAPCVRKIWEGIYGLNGHTAALPNGAPPTRLPRITPDGTVHSPHPTPTVTPGSGSSPSPTPTSSVAALPAYRPSLLESRRR